MIPTEPAQPFPSSSRPSGDPPPASQFLLLRIRQHQPLPVRFRGKLPHSPTAPSTKPPPIPKIRQNRPSPVRKRGNPPAHHATWLTYGRFGQLGNAKWLIYGTQIVISRVWGAELQRPYSGYSSFGAIYKPLSKRRPPNLPYISELPVAHPFKAHLNMPQLPRIRKDHLTPVQPRGEHAPPSSKSDRNSPFLPDSEEALHSPLIPKSDKTSPLLSDSGEGNPTVSSAKPPHPQNQTK